MSESLDVPFLPAVAHAEASETLDERFVQLYRETFRRLYAFVRTQVADAATAQEIVAQVYLKAYRHREHTPDADGRIAWLFRIARNVVIDHRRVAGKREAVTIGLDELRHLPRARENPETAVLERERLTLLLRAMGSLPERDRSLLALKFAARRTNREIAGTLGISEAAVSMRLLRALQRMRERLTATGGFP